MFAENIIQAALEQVKTTRGNSSNFISYSILVNLFILDYIIVNETLPPKVKFTTRYVAGTNFLGNKSTMNSSSFDIEYSF